MFLVSQVLFGFFSNVVGDNNNDLVGEVLVGMGERGVSKVFRFGLGWLGGLDELVRSGLGSKIIVSFMGLGSITEYLK